jgi:hypothetical protein
MGVSSLQWCGARALRHSPAWFGLWPMPVNGTLLRRSLVVIKQKERLISHIFLLIHAT